MSISSLNAAEQTFTFSAGVNMIWLDQTLAWNKTEYDDIENVTISADYVRVPSVVIPNGIDEVRLDSVKSSLIQNNGEASVIITDTFKTSCQIDITMNPFDEQQCSMMLMPSGNFYLGVDMAGSIMGGVPTFFIGNNEWKLVDLYAYVEDVPMGRIPNLVKFDFCLKRKSMFYIVSIIFPMTLLSLLNACVFLLPADSGEKMFYLISIFVSYAVFMNFVNDSIPKSGDVCRLSVYLTLVICQSCLAIITTMASLNVRSNSLLFKSETGVQPMNDEVTTNSTERPHSKSASK
ncbi:neuronal acetylcholine receptor subunit beta-4-like [Haliotis rubra]|uniref:neuronal acetylcholine receptor subunit beta-4-like n=1 Tax=Haliotis rubra TaxID=36100 RepID=UPI001EE5DBEB|nr:neuronal acetylcholine receptor subunit beta-4-like [Haliotis rubra]